MHEAPVLDDFRKAHGQDASGVDYDDPRMQQVSAGYLTQFVRDVRRVLDDIGTAKGKRLELGAWVYGQIPANLQCGFDVETWMREGLLDSIIGAAGQSTGPLDPNLIATANACGCRCAPGFIPWRHEDPVSVGPEYLYPQGADGIALWDADHLPWNQWLAFRRLGHRQECAAAASEGPKTRTLRVKSVGGCDLDKGLGAAAYSGG